MAVHERGTLVNVLVDGVDVPSGVKATITLRPVRTQRLEFPYSDCHSEVRTGTIATHSCCLTREATAFSSHPPHGSPVDEGTDLGKHKEKAQISS